MFRAIQLKLEYWLLYAGNKIIYICMIVCVFIFNNNANYVLILDCHIKVCKSIENLNINVFNINYDCYCNIILVSTLVINLLIKQLITCCPLDISKTYQQHDNIKR